MPFLNFANLGGKATITQLQQSSPPITGWMTLTLNTFTADISFDTPGWKLAQILTGIPGINVPVVVNQYGDPRDSFTWTIEFNGNTGEKIPPIVLTPVEVETNSKKKITGGLDGNVLFDVEIVRDGAYDSLSVPISQNFLYTANNEAQITVRVNGILANCPNFNCDYSILADVDVPLITAFSISDTSLTITLDQVDSLTQSSFLVSYGFSPCTNIAFVSNQITCTISQIVSGDLIPRVHIQNIGYAIPDDSLQCISVSPTLTSITPSSSSTSGGVSITIIGTGFGLSLDQPSGTTVKIGNSICQITSLSNTQIICLTSAQTTDSGLTRTVNGNSYRDTTSFSYADTKITC